MGGGQEFFKWAGLGPSKRQVRGTFHTATKEKSRGRGLNLDPPLYDKYLYLTLT